jgi:hypothetical protein
MTEKDGLTGHSVYHGAHYLQMPVLNHWSCPNISTAWWCSFLTWPWHLEVCKERIWS